MFGVERVFHSLDEACALDGVVYDLAVPGDQIVGILKRLPEGSGVLMQKPMGRDLDEAATHSGHCARSALDRGRQSPAAIQPEHAGAARSDRARRARDARRHRRPDRDRSALAQLDISRRRAAPRGAVPLDSLHRCDPVVRRRAATASIAAPCRIRNCRVCATRAARSFSTTAIASAVRSS